MELGQGPASSAHGDVSVRPLPPTVQPLHSVHKGFLALHDLIDITRGTRAGRYDLLVFRRQELLDVTEEILADEGIRNQCSADLKEVWEGKHRP